MKVMVAYSYKRNSEVSSEELCCKLGIDLEKSKLTLDVTTQMNVRFCIFPLNKRYKTYQLSQKLRRSSIKSYTDTLSFGDTSVQGNKFSQIYADKDGFVHVFSMRSKAGECDSMGNVVKYIGIMNEI